MNATTIAPTSQVATASNGSVSNQPQSAKDIAKRALGDRHPTAVTLTAKSNPTGNPDPSVSPDGHQSQPVGGTQYHKGAGKHPTPPVGTAGQSQVSVGVTKTTPNGVDLAGGVDVKQNGARLDTQVNGSATVHSGPVDVSVKVDANQTQGKPGTASVGAGVGFKLGTNSSMTAAYTSNTGKRPTESVTLTTPVGSVQGNPIMGSIGVDNQKRVTAGIKFQMATHN